MRIYTAHSRTSVLWRTTSCARRLGPSNCLSARDKSDGGRRLDYKQDTPHGNNLPEMRRRNIGDPGPLRRCLRTAFMRFVSAEKFGLKGGFQDQYNFEQDQNRRGATPAGMDYPPFFPPPHERWTEEEKLDLIMEPTWG